jgi:hypothetical protein
MDDVVEVDGTVDTSPAVRKQRSKTVTPECINRGSSPNRLDSRQKRARVTECPIAISSTRDTLLILCG